MLWKYAPAENQWLCSLNLYVSLYIKFILKKNERISFGLLFSDIYTEVFEEKYASIYN